MVRKMMFPLLLAAGFFANGQTSWADLKFKNLTSERVFISVANFESGGWRIDGWYTVDPGKTISIMRGNLDQRYYYYRANTASNRNVWEGNHFFHAHPTNRFTILEVGGRPGVLPPGARKMGFREIDTKEFRDYTVTLY